MQDEARASAIANAQAGSTFLANAIIEANNAIYESDNEKREAMRRELREQIDWALGHFEAQFDALFQTQFEKVEKENHHEE